MSDGQRERVSERRLVNGWPSAPRVRIRQARADDLDAVANLVSLAGVRLEPELVKAVVDGDAGAGLRAGLRGGRDGFTRHMAQQFSVYQDHDQLIAYLHAALLLVAEHRDHGIVGALVAYPPPNVAAEHVEQSRSTTSDPTKRAELWALGGIGLAKIKAVAVESSARGQNIGGSLLKRCKQTYLHCGYFVLYGQMPSTPGLDSFYRRSGFDVLDPGAGLDLWLVFGMHSFVHPEPDERIFFRYLR